MYSLFVKSKYLFNSAALLALCSQSASWAIEIVDPSSLRTLAKVSLVKSQYGTLKCNPVPKEEGFGPELVFLTPTFFKWLCPRENTWRNCSGRGKKKLSTRR